MSFFEYWFIFPTSILIATIAMASGVEGSTFFAPVFILGLGLPPEVAVGVGLITEVFGFASGLTAYVRRRLIDYRLGVQLLMVTVPMALVGTVVGGLVPDDILKTILGMGLFAVAASFLRSPQPDEVATLDQTIRQDYNTEQEAKQEEREKSATCLTAANGERICYRVCNKTEGRLLASIGGLFIGMLSTGLGEINGYFLLQRCRIPSKVAVASSVFIVAVTALSASIGHAIKFVQAGDEVLTTVAKLLIFTVPGVIIGGQLGPKVANVISQHVMERSLGILFLLVGVLMLGQVVVRQL
ncbi:MAG: sulfite exporter TauE/SafE family protein [Phormidesmis sp.]